jgi:hypothetical protein
MCPPEPRPLPSTPCSLPPPTPNTPRPEKAQQALTGEDSDRYMEATNAYLARLAALGVTILVSSGDDGAPGYGFTCASDPAWPVLGEVRIRGGEGRRLGLCGVAGTEMASDGAVCCC